MIAMKIKINQLQLSKTQYANMGQHYVEPSGLTLKKMNSISCIIPEELKKLKTIIQLLTDTISDNVRRIEG